MIKAKYYTNNKDVVKEKANNKYRNSSDKEKGVNRRYGKNICRKVKEKQAKQRWKNKILVFCIV